MIRNIAIFGEPTAGKSSLAELLSEKINDYNIVEASTGLIDIIANNFDSKRLPKNPKYFISRFKKIINKSQGTLRNKINRETAREIYIVLCKQYGNSFIAKALEGIYFQKFNNQPIILTGIRGYQNAKYFKEKNYLLIFLKANKKILLKRLAKVKNYSRKSALDELKAENRLYSTKKIEKESDLVFDTSRNNISKIANQVINFLFKPKECKKCINTNQNPFIEFTKSGYCTTCDIYLKNFNKKALEKELKFLKSFIGKGKKKYDIMVGLSGGKDSSATLYQIKKMGFTPLAYTFETGYFHPYIYRRAKSVARKIGVDYKIIPVRKYLTEKIAKRFRRMARLYKRNNKQEFISDYKNGRYKYRGVVRPCWVCRELIIRARYFEAIKHGVNVIATGLNEWTSLKQTVSGRKYKISAIRKLKPYKNKPAVYIVHFPFLIQASLEDTKKVLKKIGWNYYRNVQSNAASCLLAHAAEKQLYENLKFHPDTTRLAREITVGFLTKRQAKNALKKSVKSKYNIPEMLKKAKIIN